MLLKSTFKSIAVFLVLALIVLVTAPSVRAQANCAAGCQDPNTGFWSCNLSQCFGCPTCGGSVNTGPVFGAVNPPPGVSAYNSSGNLSGVTTFLSAILRLLVILAGIWAIFNLVFAGYAFMSAGDDSKKIEGAWAKIWQTLLGLAVAAGAFLLAAIFGQILFHDPGALLRIQIFGPPA